MSRDDGFPIADVSVNLLDDPKFRKLWRLLKDPNAMSQVVALYLATVLASWRAGEPVSAHDAAPAWMTDVDGPLDNLRGVNLLGDDGLIPPDTWSNWFTPAWDRREAKRQAGAEGGRRSWADGGGRRQQQGQVSNASAQHQQRFSTASAEGQDSVTRPSVRPSVPSFISNASATHQHRFSGADTGTETRRPMGFQPPANDSTEERNVDQSTVDRVTLTKGYPDQFLDPKAARRRYQAQAERLLKDDSLTDAERDHIRRHWTGEARP
jgi:hypothetical protein